MINKKKIDIFNKYEGEIDAWVRFGTSEEKRIMSGDDWYQIFNLIINVKGKRIPYDDLVERYDIEEGLENEIRNL